MATIQIADKPTLDAVKTQVDNVYGIVSQQGSAMKRFGVRIDKLNSDPRARVEYIFDAVGMTPAGMVYSGDQSANVFNYGDWENLWFVKGNYPVMLNNNGTVAYKLDPNDYTKKDFTGDTSDYDNTSFAGNAMVRIPRVYVSFTQDARYEYISVCEYKYDDSYKAIAHTLPDGTEVEEIYIAMYTGSFIDNKLRSLAGQWPMMSKTAAQEASAATANGTGWYTRTWGQRQLINALLTIMGKSDDTQTVFGKGRESGYVNDAAQHYGMLMSNVNADNSVMSNKGQFFGYSDSLHHMKVFHIEDYWANQWDRVAGLMLIDNTLYASLTGPYNITAAGYEKVSIPKIVPNGSGDNANLCSGYAASTYNTPYGRIPYDVYGKTPAGARTSGSASTYLCDYFWARVTGTYYALVGGACGSGAFCGASYLSLHYAPSHSSWYFGASPSYVPGFTG